MNTCSSQRVVGPERHESRELREVGRINSTLAISWLRPTIAFRLLSTASCDWYGNNTVSQKRPAFCLL